MREAKTVNGVPIYTDARMAGWTAWADLPDLRLRTIGRKTERAAVEAVAREVRARTKGVK